MADYNDLPPGEIFEKGSILPEEQKAIQFYEFYTKSIEINFNGKLVRVYFKVDPYYSYLTDNSKSILQCVGSFDTRTNKLRSFLKVIDKVHNETKHLKKLESYRFRFTKKRLEMLRKCSLYLMYGYNLIIVSCSVRGVEENKTFIWYQSFFGYDDSEGIIFFLGFC